MAISANTQRLIDEARRKHAALLAARATLTTAPQAQDSARSAPAKAGSFAANSHSSFAGSNGVGSFAANSNGTHAANGVAALPLSTALNNGAALINAAGFRVPAAGTAGAPTFNPEQQLAIELALQGKSFCLIGAAGTGKTTVTQAIIERLQRAAHCLPISESTKHLGKDNPGIVVVGFTNKAVNNIRKKLPKHLQPHCLTIHKLLEYAPVYYEVADSDGNTRTTMRFEPARNGANPLPHISTLISEESSMIGTDLFGQEVDALRAPGRTQFIFLGDLNQIPPVFGPSILGFKLAEMQTVELVHVYRQALLSPIISLATAIRTNAQALRADAVAGTPWHASESGMSVPTKLTEKITIDRGEHGKLTVHPWKQRVSSEAAIGFMKRFLPTMIEGGVYDPQEDMILCPFNKSFGTIELNRIIADHLGRKAQTPVFEVIARYVRSYWAVGDRVLVDRHEAEIRSIEPTLGYYGKAPRPESLTMDRWGDDVNNPAPKAATADEILNALDGLAEGADGEAKNLASHTITVWIPDLEEERTLNTAGDINNMLFGYALTIHKSQGSEWPRVFLFLHNSHATMISRELVYTAVTRAKQELYIICEGDTKPYENSLNRAAGRPIIPGITLAEKISFFAEKAKSMKASSTSAEA